MSHITYHDGHNVYCKFSGMVTAQEIIWCNMSIYESVYFDSLKVKIIDLSGIDGLCYSVQDTKEMAAYDKVALKINAYVNNIIIIKDQFSKTFFRIYQNQLNNPGIELNILSAATEIPLW